MDYLTVSKIIEIHDEIIKEYGGTRGLRDEGTLELLVYKANRGKTIFRRAALILYIIASAHPFFDGNKRSAIMTAENVLGTEGYFLNAEAEEITNLMLKIAKYECSVEAIEGWLKEKAQRLHIS
ncbi:Fic/DOC family protein [uncultured archaeon]|nr:Fic/DOC family protein [uncultured archaeon]